MGKRRQRRDAETQELMDARWHGIRQQWALEARNHSAEENMAANRRGQQLVAEHRRRCRGQRLVGERLGSADPQYAAWLVDLSKQK